MQFIDPASFVFVTVLVGVVTSCLLVVAHAGLERDTVPLVFWVLGDLSFTAHRVALLLQPGAFGPDHAGLALAPGSTGFILATSFIVLAILLHSLGLGLMAGRRLRPALLAAGLAGPVAAYVLATAALPQPVHRMQLLFAATAVLAALHITLMWPLLHRSRGAKIMAVFLAGVVLHNLATAVIWTVQPPQMPPPQPGVPVFPPPAVLVLDFVVSLLMTFSFALVMQEHIREHIQRLSSTDQLTGALNRHGAMPLLAQEWQRAARYGRPLALVMLDLDHFKRINDQHGHAAGDAVLAAFARRVAALKRGPDCLARWGGEEFLLVMPETGAAEAAQAVERMRAAVAAQPLVPGLPGTTFSAGVAATRPGAPPDGIDTLLREADQRLYAAKATRNCVVAGEERSDGLPAGHAVPVSHAVPATG
jgi:diguanylate cyclase (GGDEF)-like protein